MKHLTPKHISLLAGTGLVILGILAGYGFAVGGMDTHRAGDKRYQQKEVSMMHDTMEAMTENLTTRAGDDFEHEFLHEMVKHHEGAIAMAELVLQKSNREELRTLAQAIITAQTQEIETMHAWEREWFHTNHDEDHTQ